MLVERIGNGLLLARSSHTGRDILRRIFNWCAFPMTEQNSHWDYFNWPNIIQEARLRHEQEQKSTAAAVTPEMRTLEYWTAWVAHANAAACLTNPKQTSETPQS